MAKLSPSQIVDTLLAAGWPNDPDLLTTMTAIALWESGGGNTQAANCSTSRECSIGLLQINTLAHHEYSRQQLYDPVTNARAGLSVYYQQGLRAWGAYTDGNYRRYLSAASVAIAQRQGQQTQSPAGLDASSGADGQGIIGDLWYSDDGANEPGYTPASSTSQGAAVAVVAVIAAFLIRRFAS